MRFIAALLGLVVSPLVAQGFGPELLGPPTPIDGFWEGTPFVIRDVNGDGQLDLLGNDSFDRLTFAPGLADGSFEPPLVVEMNAGFAPPYDAVDLDLDGWPDLVTDAFFFAVHVRRGLGQNSFAPIQSSPIPSGQGKTLLVIADLDGDGLPDALVSQFYFGGGRLSASHGQGDGTFGGFGVVAQTRSASQLQVADVDGDGDLDVIEVDEQTSGLAVLDEGLVSFLNQGDGVLDKGVLAAPLTANSVVGVAGDHDQDGLPDVLSWDATTGEVVELLGQGNGLFEPQAVMDLGVPLADAMAVDLDRDGFVDLVALRKLDSSGPANDVVLQRLVGLEPEGDPLVITPAKAPGCLDAADFDGDALPELAVGADIGVIGGVFVYPNALGPIVDLGLGTPGGPVLAVTGQPAAGEVVEVSLQTAGSTPALLFVGLQALPLPFKGALLVPDPLLSVPLVAPAAFSATWPAGFPAGTLVYLQGFVPAGSGAAGSNAVMLVPEP